MSGQSEGGTRHGNRIRTGVPAEVHERGRRTACEARNISRSGVLLVGDLAMPAADTVDFALKLPMGSLEIQLSGRVIRVEPDPDGHGQRMALEFVNMNDARQGALEALLARVRETPTAGPFDRLKPGSTPQEIRKALEAVPLPQRIALSSRAGLKEREILRMDTHPAVLEALARSPNLSLIEARALAASVHLLPGTLDALANDLRFKGDEELLMVVALHPRVSSATAEKVTAGFKPPQIKKLLARPGLNQSLREKLLRRTIER